MIAHSIKSEIQFIELLGYEVVGPDHSNHWIIFDENHKEVGFIQYKKLCKGNKAKYIPDTFGYLMEIDSDKIRISREKVFGSEKKKNLVPDLDAYEYKFYIKRKNGNDDYVVLNMGSHPSLTISSDIYGPITFEIDNHLFHVNYQRDTGSFHTEERILYQYTIDSETEIDTQRYMYDFKLWPKEAEEKSNVKELNVEYIATYEHILDRKVLKKSEYQWIDDRILWSEDTIVDDDILEVIRRRKTAHEAFQYFQYFVGIILPFQGDVIENMLKRVEITSDVIRIFIPNIKAKQKIQKK